MSGLRQEMSTLRQETTQGFREVNAKMDKQFQGVNGRIDRILENQQKFTVEVTREIANLRVEVTEIRGDVSELQGTVKQVQGEVKELQTRFDEGDLPAPAPPTKN